MKTKQLKTRVHVRTFIEKTDTSFRVVGKWTVEILNGRRWVLLGDESGLRKFDTKEAAETWAAEQVDLASSQNTVHEPTAQPGSTKPLTP